MRRIAAIVLAVSLASTARAQTAIGHSSACSTRAISEADRPTLTADATSIVPSIECGNPPCPLRAVGKSYLRRR